jgi:hypothetical protein
MPPLRTRAAVEKARLARLSRSDENRNGLAGLWGPDIFNCSFNPHSWLFYAIGAK